MKNNASARMNLATMIAATLGAFGGRMVWSAPVTPKMHNPVPTMVTSPPEEIAAWNAAIDARKPSRPTKLHRKSRGDTGQHPKFQKARVHKQHKHPLRDGHGAYTLVGGAYEMVAAPGEHVTPTSREHVFGGAFGDGGHTEYTARRIWLGGISAQRGY